MNTISLEDKKRLKDMGGLLNRDGEHFSVRVLTENGVVNHEKIQHIAEASKLFGDGNMALTSRMSIEITGVKIDKIEDLLKFLSDHNIVTGGTGWRVRPIVSCK